MRIENDKCIASSWQCQVGKGGLIRCNAVFGLGKVYLSPPQQVVLHVGSSRVRDTDFIQPFLFVMVNTILDKRIGKQFRPAFCTHKKGHN